MTTIDPETSHTCSVIIETKLVKMVTNPFLAYAATPLTFDDLLQLVQTIKYGTVSVGPKENQEKVLLVDFKEDGTKDTTTMARWRKAALAIAITKLNPDTQLHFDAMDRSGGEMSFVLCFSNSETLLVSQNTIWEVIHPVAGSAADIVSKLATWAAEVR